MSGANVWTCAGASYATTLRHFPDMASVKAPFHDIYMFLLRLTRERTESSCLSTASGNREYFWFVVVISVGCLCHERWICLVLGYCQRRGVCSQQFLLARPPNGEIMYELKERSMQYVLDIHFHDDLSHSQALSMSNQTKPY